MTAPLRSRCPTRLKIEDWPEPDRAAWNAATTRGAIFEDAGLGAHWSDGTRMKYAASYGYWLAFLSRRGQLAHAQCPAARVNSALIKAYVNEVEARCSGQTAVMRVVDLYCVLRASQPDHDWSWLRASLGRLRECYGHSDLKPLPDISAREIFVWGRQEMRRAQTNGSDTRLGQAARFRDGLIVSLLISRPLRRRNFVAIEIGKHLVEVPDGFQLIFEAAETKTHRRLEHPVPESLFAALERYIEVYRPVLLRGNHSACLWITKRGRPYTVVGFSKKIEQVTRRAFDRSFGPHAFRHIAATTIATDDPEHARIIMDILGHTTLTIADSHYNRARQIDALQRYQQVLAGFCKQAAEA